jgi:DNA-binding CsgD family transcriptional regulator
MPSFNFDPPSTWFPKLSPRQAEVLRWTAEGKTSWEISVIMHCTEATVNYHLKQLFVKLDASNKTHAVSKAFTFGLLPYRANTFDDTDTRRRGGATTDSDVRMTDAALEAV